MEFTYKKHENDKLFASLEKHDMGLSKLQNYIPLYNNFFALNTTNWNAINLNNELYLHSIKSRQTDTIVTGLLKDIQDKQKYNKQIFFKYSPLLDPLKYLIGKYDITNPQLLALPTLTDVAVHEKMRDVNNAAYVDSFFSYLTSKLLHVHNFPHGLDFYGSFLSQKDNYKVNVSDDIDYIEEFSFFHSHKADLFTVDENYINLFGNDTRRHKEKLDLSAMKENDDIILTEFSELDARLDHGLEGGTSSEGDSNSTELIYETNHLNESKERKSASSSTHSSSCSSRSSISSVGSTTGKATSGAADDADSEDGAEDADADADADADDTDADTDDEAVSDVGEDIFVKIKQFPVQVIALECCDATLDSLIINEHHTLNDDEWTSITLQLLMTLIVYQNTFRFTHNDLHSNNVMYTQTDKTFLYYKVDGAYYKVPTYGKLFKLIDFGRAIYKFKGQMLCSDSFHPKGDAATQYNCQPYFNPNKPVVEPNFSFDLCRLGCSIYDCIVDNISDEVNVTSPILKIIIDWCKDDKGRNILYKKNGDERYPDFKLYKMISRKVHKHVPINVLRNTYFDKFKITKKKIGKDKTIINIDELPCYV